ncbi:hypothetical protein [Chryseobacterium arthrosphaerae]|uniref:hypothetical protein n=1 Tax=Chryseobacterium arthrosphaerae TaxID=651561 RepID=UPI001E463C7E|nr:hypothetical protein [Chryseobacterium arthrosphaerae]UEQ75692.1 hypothetical protein J8N07_18895 [Chryseobacterium arthrosphaerae]
MKKILPFILLAGIGFLAYSCDNNDDVVVQNPVDSDTLPVMKDVNVSLNSSNNYAHVELLNLQSTDVVLVYRKDPTASNAWQLVPKTYYLANNRELEYNFLFNSQKVEIFTEGVDPATLTSAEAGTYLNNQTFRIVLVYANAGKAAAGKNAKANVDYSDYNAVVKYYNLDESKVKTVNVN